MTVKIQQLTRGKPLSSSAPSPHQHYDYISGFGGKGRGEQLLLVLLFWHAIFSLIALVSGTCTASPALAIFEIIHSYQSICATSTFRLDRHADIHTQIDRRHKITIHLCNP